MIMSCLKGSNTLYPAGPGRIIKSVLLVLVVSGPGKKGYMTDRDHIFNVVKKTY